MHVYTIADFSGHVSDIRFWALAMLLIAAILSFEQVPPVLRELRQ
jgi:hypothetical protein